MADRYWEGTVSTDPIVGGNWSGGVVPAGGDDVIFDDTAQDNCAGGIIAAAIASLTIREGCTIDIGTSAADALDFNFAGAAGVVDDRGTGTRYLYGVGTGTWNVYGSGAVSVDGITNDFLNINAPGATVTVGPLLAVLAQFKDLIRVAAGTVHIHHVTTQAPGPFNLTVEGGTVDTRYPMASVLVRAGTLIHYDGALTTLHADGGVITYNSDGTITTVELQPGSKLEFAPGYRAVTVDDCQVVKATLLDSWSRVAWTNGITFPENRASDCLLDFGINRKFTPIVIP